MSSGTYLPSEDTAAISRVLRAYHGGKCLEIGFGSGAVLASLEGRFRLVVGTDLVTLSQARSAKGNAEVVLADAGSCFRDGVFDLVAFNPPYLPSEKVLDRTTDGGAGIEVPLRFLDDALRVAKRDGRVVVLLSTESDVEAFRSACEARGLTLEEKERTQLFFESLLVFELRRPT